MSEPHRDMLASRAGEHSRQAAQDDWLCPSCAAGEALPPPRPSACTMREKYLGGTAGVELVRITGLWRDAAAQPSGFVFRGRWYERPENTHCGRQASSVGSLAARASQRMVSRAAARRRWRCTPLSTSRTDVAARESVQAPSD